MTADVIDHVVVTPSSIVLAPRMQHQFEAVAKDRFGITLLGLAFIWNVETGNRTIDPSGLFTAGAEPVDHDVVVEATAMHGGHAYSATASVTVVATESTAVSAGGSHTCAVTDAGAVNCWGYGRGGQLGDRTAIDRSNPVDVNGLNGGASAVSAGSFRSCALMTSGGIKCWGRNKWGALGDGTTGDRNRPVDVVGLSDGGVAIASGREYVGAEGHTCALTEDGSLRCWGRNSWGQLGASGQDRVFNQSASFVPVEVTGLTTSVVAVTAGARHTCVVSSEAGLTCWGDNEFGQLGRKKTNIRPTSGFVDVPGLTEDVAASSAGGAHTCAVTTLGGVKCWGNNQWGQLGDGTTVDRDAPTDVLGLTSGAVTISAGAAHTCALTTLGGVECWGSNFGGQLGNATNTGSATPVDVIGLTSGVISISAGGYHTCAITRARELKCWGRNDQGQLGDGTTESRSTPVDVIGFPADPAPSPTVVPPTSFAVNSNADRVDARPGDGACDDGTGSCTLRAAIMEANALIGTRTIILPSGNYTLSIAGTGEDNAEAGDLDITTGVLTISGAGARATIIDGGGLDRVLDVHPTVVVSISNVTITNGVLSDRSRGGAVRNAGELTFTDSLITGNSTHGGGGAIYNSVGARLTVASSSITNNSSSQGTIFNNGSFAYIVNSTIAHNTASFNSAGIFNGAGSLMILENSTVSLNSASRTGGGISNSGRLVLNFSTVVYNTAGIAGGGISNTAAIVLLRGSIIAANTPTDIDNRMHVVPGLIISAGHNLLGNERSSDFLPTTGDLVGVDAALGPLQDNGGLTFTHALLSGSPALDAVDGGITFATSSAVPANPEDPRFSGLVNRLDRARQNPAAVTSTNVVCPDADQRGVPRPQGMACDIGAVEIAR